MIEILKALFWVIVAGLFRLLGVTRKRPAERVPYITVRGNDERGKPEEPPHWKRQAIEKANFIVRQILSTGDFSDSEKALIYMITHIVSGLVDKPGVIVRCHFQFIPDQKVRIEFMGEDAETGTPITTMIKGVEDNEISLKGRGYLADYIKGLIQYQHEKDRVTAAVRATTPKGGNDDQDNRPDED